MIFGYDVRNPFENMYKNSNSDGHREQHCMLCIIYTAEKSQNATCTYSGPIKSIVAVCI